MFLVLHASFFFVQTDSCLSIYFICRKHIHSHRTPKIYGNVYMVKLHLAAINILFNFSQRPLNFRAATAATTTATDQHIRNKAVCPFYIGMFFPFIFSWLGYRIGAGWGLFVQSLFLFLKEAEVICYYHCHHHHQHHRRAGAALPFFYFFFSFFFA